MHAASYCARCGSCRIFCPVWQARGWEGFSPRGRVEIFRAVFREKRLPLSEGVLRRLAECTLCGACEASCAAGLNLRELWLEARALLAGAGIVPEGYRALRENLLRNGNVSQFPNTERLAWAEDLDDGPEGLDRAQEAEVVYHVGCVASFYPRASQVALSLVSALRRLGIAVTTLGEAEYCCGYPLEAAGFPDLAAEFRARNVAGWKELGVRLVVTSCPSCYYRFREAPEVAAWGGEVMHHTVFLARLLEEGRLPLRQEGRGRVTYHDPCDLGRHSGIFAEPRLILRRLGYEVVELSHSGKEARCCGGGGNLQAVAPDLALTLAEARVQEALATGAGILVSACQQCEQVLEQAARKLGARLRVADVVELLEADLE